jgi:hypothetical protein
MPENREARVAGLDRVWPRRQLGEREVPRAIGDGLTGFVGLFAQELDLDARQPRTRLIDDNAADRRARCLGPDDAVGQDGEEGEERGDGG